MADPDAWADDVIDDLHSGIDETMLRGLLDGSTDTACLAEAAIVTCLSLANEAPAFWGRLVREAATHAIHMDPHAKASIVEFTAEHPPPG